MAVERAGDHRDTRRAPRVVDRRDLRDVVVPEHREVRVGHLVDGREVQPDLEQLERVRPLAVEEREHLGVHDALARGEPLHVAAPEAGRGAERIGVVDDAAAHVGDGLEARGAGAAGTRGRRSRDTCSNRRRRRSRHRSRGRRAPRRGRAPRSRPGTGRRGARRRGRVDRRPLRPERHRLRAPGRSKEGRSRWSVGHVARVRRSAGKASAGARRQHPAHRVALGRRDPEPVPGLHRDLVHDVGAAERAVRRQPARRVGVALGLVRRAVDRDEVDRVVGEPEPLVRGELLARPSARRPRVPPRGRSAPRSRATFSNLIIRPV